MTSCASRLTSAALGVQNVPVAADADPQPLWQVLRADLDERGYSVRGFAKMCHEANPSATWDSWKRTLNRTLDADRDPPYTVSLETAELWSRLLKKPKSRYVRPQARKTARERALEQEVERLRQENESYRRRLGRGARGAGGNP